MGETDEVQQSRRIAEEAREARWQGESFLRDVFLGQLHPRLLAPPGTAAKRGMADAEFATLYVEVKRFLEFEVDPAQIDATGEYPAHVLDGLTRLGLFGLKIERAYGGLGVSHVQYVEMMQLLGSHDANVTALLSAHQSIGVPHPVQMFGSEDLKRRYLPRCAKGAISAFALTEPSVGSDPARLESCARLSPDGREYILDGLKLWCTNGTLAAVIVVLAKDPDTGRISCFVVETDWEGVTIEKRCRFMGLRALGNALISFHAVHVPRENVIGREGDGLRVALATLNTGRLTLPAATAGAAKVALEVSRKWAAARVQWGQPIGKHEAIAHQLATMASTTYAMECLAWTVGDLADHPERDLRLEAAAAKEWNTVAGWHLTDSALQIRGGRGYETELSLAARGEPPIGIERMLRDSRINRIFEGSSEIMHLFIAREALDKHLSIAGVLVDPRVSPGRKLRALPRVVAFYALWYPALWLSAPWAFVRFRGYGPLGAHLRYAAGVSRRLARALFHAMLRNGPGLERKQALLFRAVDVALEIFALVATVTRAHARRTQDERGPALADRHARDARHRIEDLLRDMRRNDDGARYRLGCDVMDGEQAWLERGTVGLPFTSGELVPTSTQEYLDQRRRESHRALKTGSAS